MQKGLRFRLVESHFLAVVGFVRFYANYGGFELRRKQKDGKQYAMVCW